MGEDLINHIIKKKKVKIFRKFDFWTAKVEKMDFLHF